MEDPYDVYTAPSDEWIESNCAYNFLQKNYYKDKSLWNKLKNKPDKCQKLNSVSIEFWRQNEIWQREQIQIKKQESKGDFKKMELVRGNFEKKRKKFIRDFKKMKKKLREHKREIKKSKRKYLRERRGWWSGCRCMHGSVEIVLR